MSLDADRSGSISAFADTWLRVPEGLHRVHWYIEGSGGEWRRGRRFLSSGLGLFSAGALHLSLDEATLGNGQLVFESHQPLELPPESFLDKEWSGPLELDWSHGLVAQTAAPRDSTKAKWVVVFNLDQTQIQRLDPAPTSIDRHGSRAVVRWEFPPGHAQAVQVRLKPPWAVTFVHDIVADDWGELMGLAYLILTLMFLPVLYLLRRRYSELWRPNHDDGTPLGCQLNWLLVAAAMGLLTGVLWLLRTQMFDRVSGFSGWALPAQIVIGTLPSIAAAAFSVAVFAAGREGYDRQRLLAAWLIMVIAFVLAAAFDGPVLPRVFVPASGFWETISAWVGVGAALAGITLMTNGLSRVLFSGLGARLAGLLQKWGLTADVVGLVAAGVLIYANLVVYGRASGDWRYLTDVTVPFTTVEGVYAAAPLLPLVVLPGVVRLLANSRPPTPFVVSSNGALLTVIVLFLFFVVPPSGTLAGFAVPVPVLSAVVVFAILARTRKAKLDRFETAVNQANPERAGSAGTSLLIEHHGELVDRALMSEHLNRSRAAAYQRKAKGEEGGEDHVAYRGRLDELDRAQHFLQTGEVPQGASPSGRDEELVRLRLPSKPPVLYPALALGPGRDWRENGEIALRYGAVLAVFPVLYFLYVLLKHESAALLSLPFGFEPMIVVTFVVGEVAFWLTAAYVFGCLFSWLPLGNGTLKGLLLSLPVIAGILLSVLCPVYVALVDWPLRAFALLFFLSLLGLLMDLRSVRTFALRWRDLVELYRIRSLRFGVVKLAPLLIAAFGIYQQLHAGQDQSGLKPSAEAASSRGPGSANGEVTGNAASGSGESPGGE